MSSFLLINELKQRLNDELQDWYLEHPIGDNIKRAKPNIIIGQLPPKTGSMPSNATTQQRSDSDVPFILIRPLENTFSSEDPCMQVLNVAIVCGIHSSDSYEKYERGVEEILNLIDKISLSIKKYQFWGKNHFNHYDEIKCTYGLPKSIDPYEAGLQADAPFFAAVAITSFVRTINIPKTELNTIFS